MSYSYDRTARTAAAQGSLRAAKLEWALELCEKMADRFKNYGGWRVFKVRSTSEIVADAYAHLEVRSDEYGWTGHVQVQVEGTPSVQAWINVDSKAPKAVEGDIDLMELLGVIDDETETFKVVDTMPAERLVMDVSLFFSQALNPLLAENR